MSRLRVEPSDELTHQVCAHCGKGYASTYGFVSRDGEPHAVYFAALYERHPDRRAHLGIGIAHWSAGAEVADVAAIVDVTLRDQVHAYDIAGPETSPWADAQLLRGSFIAADDDRGERPVVLSIADQIVARDRAVRGHLAG